MGASHQQSSDVAVALAALGTSLGGGWWRGLMEGLRGGANSCTGPSPARNAAGLDQQPDAMEPGRAGLFPISYLQAAGFCSGVGGVCSGGCANCPATSVP